MGCIEYMERVTVRRDGDRFDLCVGGRYTVVLGLSGEGKTWLTSLANKCFEDPGLSEVTGRYKSIAAAGGKHWASVFKSDVDIVVVDEDIMLESFWENELLEKMAEYEHHYLILSRGCLGKIPFGIEDMYDMEWLSEHHVRMVPHQWVTPLLRKAVNPANFILCEDKKSGYVAAKESYKNCGTHVESAGGKDNLASSGITSGYIAADLCGLGLAALALAPILRYNPNVQLCDIISFEAECLRSQGVLPELPGDVVSAEAFYEEALRGYLLSKYNLAYSKGNEDVVRALVTGHYSHSHQKLEGWVRSDWWIPGVPHNDVQWLLQAYHDTFDEEFTGTIPPEVFAIQEEELRRNVMDILIKMRKSK